MLTQRSKEAADKVSLQKAESMLGTYLRVDDDRLEDYLWRIGDNKRIASVNSYRGRTEYPWTKTYQGVTSGGAHKVWLCTGL